MNELEQAELAMMKKLDELMKKGYQITIIRPSGFGEQRNTEDDN